MQFTSCENTGGLMAEGDYEVICLKAVLTSTQSTGQPVIKFDFQVRSDVEQKYQRKHVFKNFYSEEDGKWPEAKIGAYANALGIPKGEEFELSDLIGRCCIVHMGRFTGQDGTERECIRYVKPTKAGQAVQTLNHPPQGEGFEQVDDEDLPF